MPLRAPPKIKMSWVDKLIGLPDPIFYRVKLVLSDLLLLDFSSLPQFKQMIFLFLVVVSGPTYRIGSGEIERLVAPVREIAREISARLGSVSERINL